MRKTITAAALFAGLVIVGAPAGCFFDLADDCSFNMNLECYYNNQGGSGGTGGSAPECIPSATNKQIDESCGAFVSPTGSDATGDGTMGNPYLTLQKAADMKPRVYACANADKALDGAVEPKADVVFYGGFDCTALEDWVYDPTKKSAWTAPSDSVPLTVSGDIKVEVYDFAITARDAAMAGGSSLAVLAAGDKTELLLERCDVVAGAGKDGVTPETPSGTGTPGGAGKDGAAGCVDTTSKLGGDAGTNTCDGNSRNGGPGGNGTTADGGQGSDGQPQPGPTPADGKGGIGQIGAASCAAGEFGADGTAGTAGKGATTIGTLSASGYSGGTGGDGKADATAGQGGGGGGGAKACTGPNVGNAGPGGGGGGAGGCPGTQVGKGGGPGGASIGVASVGALVTLNDVHIMTNKGGEGGTGGDGQSGGLGGNAGHAGTNKADGQASACDGGKGGKGGDAGPGGGGQGGHSVALAFSGTAPKQTKVVLNPGVAGGGGVAGAKDMTPGTKGGNGRSCGTLSFDKEICL